MLTPQQLQAIELLSESKRSQQSIADEVGVTRRTVVRWFANPEFQAALAGVGSNQFVVNPDVIEPENAIEPEIIKPQKSRFSVRERLNGLIPVIIDETEAILTNPDTRTSDKLRAAQLLAKWSGLDDKSDSDRAMQHLAEMGVISVESLDLVIESLNTYMESLENILKGEFKPSKNFEDTKTPQSAISGH